MEMTQLSVLIIALGVTIAFAGSAMLAWRLRARRLAGQTLEDRYRKDVQALKRRSRVPDTERVSDDIWSAGADSDSPYSRSKKAAAWVAIGSVGCGGCGGCGCGG